MLNKNVYVPPHRRSLNVYVPPHRRSEGQSKDLSITTPAKVPIKDTKSHDKTPKSPQLQCDKCFHYSSSSSSDSSESLVGMLSSITIDESRSSPVIDCSRYGHIVEISGFLPGETSTHIEKSFQDYCKPGFALKWVDDEHCLIVFPSEEIARTAIGDERLLRHFALSGVEEACRGSRCKILRSPGDWALPYKSRPPVLLNPSRRMIYHSLGISACITEEQRRVEADKIRDFRNGRSNDAP